MKFNTPEEVFAAIEKGFDPEKADRNAVIQVHLTGDNGGDWVITIQDRQLSVRPGSSDHANMSMSLSATDFVKMVNREVNPMNLFMMGKIKITGDMSLAMKLQAMLSA